MRVVQYDYDRLPALPFNIYILDAEGKVSPKRIYTVTRKRIDIVSSKIELFILEFEQYIFYNSQVVLVNEFCVNERKGRYGK